MEQYQQDRRNLEEARSDALGGIIFELQQKPGSGRRQLEVSTGDLLVDRLKHTKNLGAGLFICRIHVVLTYQPTRHPWKLIKPKAHCHSQIQAMPSRQSIDMPRGNDHFMNLGSFLEEVKLASERLNQNIFIQFFFPQKHNIHPRTL